MTVYCSHTCSQLWFGWSSSGSSPSTIFLHHQARTGSQGNDKSTREHAETQVSWSTGSELYLALLLKWVTQPSPESQWKCHGTIRWRSGTLELMELFHIQISKTDLRWMLLVLSRAVSKDPRMSCTQLSLAHSFSFFLWQSPSLLNSYC